MISCDVHCASIENIDCNIQAGNEDFKYIVKYTNIIKYWSLFNLIISVSPLDNNGYFTLSLARDVIDTEIR